MDRKISPKELSRSKWRSYFNYFLLFLLAVAVVFAFRYFLSASAQRSQFRIEAVNRGDIKNTVTATGLVVAAFEEQLNAPVSTTIKKVLLPTGTEVKAGDVILMLDEEYVQLQLNGRRDQLALRRNNVDLLKLEYDRDLKDLEYNSQIKGLQLSSAEAQLADARRLLEIGGATEEDVERAELDVEIIRLERDKLINQLNYSKNSLDGRRRNLELEVGMEEKEVAQLSRKLRETEVRAPRAGVVTWINETIGQQVVEGAPLVRIADLGRFRLEGSCSDRYAGQVSGGLPVDIRVGKQRLPGIITTILPEVENNTLRFLVEFDNPSHPALRPSLRTEFDIVIGEKPNVLRVKNGPVFRGGIRQEVFIVRDNQVAVRQEIGLGMRNGDWIEINSGVAPGDRIIISDTKDYEHLSSFKLE